jgi:glycoside/pentoside/hexuronide:cation symporter, GPH family
MVDRLRSGTVAAYATAVAPTAILSVPFSIYLPPFIAEGGVLSIATIGLIFSISAAWDGLVDPIIGSVVDRVKAGEAPHRRWMTRAVVPLAILLMLLIAFGERSSAFIVLPILLLFYSSFSLFEVAHLSWGAALAKNQEDSSRLFGARELGGKTALVLALGVPAALQAIRPESTLEERMTAYAVMALLAIPMALFAIRKLPARPIIPQPGIGWRAEIGASLKSRPLRLLLSVQFTNAFASGSLTALFIFFLDAYLQLSKISSIILFLTFVGTALAAPIWTLAAQRLSKPRVMIAMPMWLIFILGIGFFLPRGETGPAILFGLTLGMGFVGLIFIYGMVSDLAPVDAELVGRDRTAFLFAIVNVTQKIGIALAIAVSYALLDIGGFEATNKAASADIVRTLFLVLPATSWAVMALFLLKLMREPLFHKSIKQKKMLH